MFPRANAPFKWVGIRFLWAPSSHLPTQVKGGPGRGWARSACIRFCAVPAPSSQWTHGPSIQLALSPPHKETTCTAANGRAAGRTVWATSQARWVGAEPSGKALTGTQQGTGRVGSPLQFPGHRAPGEGQEHRPLGVLDCQWGAWGRRGAAAPHHQQQPWQVLAELATSILQPFQSGPSAPRPGLWKKGKENGSSCERAALGQALSRCLRALAP